MHASHWIAITTIAAPTVAVEEFAAMARRRGWGVSVAGDTKTPADFAEDGVDYLSIDRQKALFGAYSDATPVRHYARKNFAYLHAIANGAEVIVESDDDNRPYPSFGTDIEKTVQGRLLGGGDWVNAYRYFTDDQLIWPRGLPLDRIHDLGTATPGHSVDCPIQQFLADSDPDVDAIYRLLFREPFNFDKAAQPAILANGSYCPFNSQNTIIHADAFELLYLPAFVSFRMTDIWRSFVAQRILWEQGKSVSFHAPSVFQERNAHNLMRDFADEVVGYLRNDEIARTLTEVELTGLSSADALLKCYRALLAIGIVPDEEIVLVEHWLEAVAKARG